MGSSPGSGKALGIFIGCRMTSGVGGGLVSRRMTYDFREFRQKGYLLYPQSAQYFFERLLASLWAIGAYLIRQLSWPVGTATARKFFHFKRNLTQMKPTFWRANSDFPHMAGWQVGFQIAPEWVFHLPHPWVSRARAPPRSASSPSPGSSAASRP